MSRSTPRRAGRRARAQAKAAGVSGPGDAQAVVNPGLTARRVRAALYGLVGAGVLAAVVLTALLAVTKLSGAPQGYFPSPLGVLELDVRSEYSHIRLYRKDQVRTLVFVRDSGEEALETQVDLANPHQLRFTYLEHLFLSYVFRPEQQRVLIVGLGGGSMVHFLKHYDPGVQVDAVEIDPVVVRIADQYFGVRSEGNVRVITADAFEFLANTTDPYDVIYMDAFLKPSADTDSTGVPLRLKTIRFYQDVQKKLKPGGVVAFNMNPHARMREDIETMRAAFAQVYVFPLPGYQGSVVIASTAPERQRLPALLARAAQLDRRFKTSFSFRTMVQRLAR